MRNYLFILLILITNNIFAQYSKPKVKFEDLLIQTELNPDIQLKAKNLAMKLNQPVEIFLKEKIYIEAKSVEDDKIVYAVIVNPLNIYDGAYTAFLNEIESKYDLSKAKIDFGNGRIVNPLNLQEYKEPAKPYYSNEVVLVCESQQKRVISFNPQTGDLISETFIAPQGDLLNLPKHLLQLPNKEFIISDQNKDGVIKYDTSRTYVGYLAPAGGPNTSILDNIRGIAFKKSNGNLLVTCAASSSPNSIREFNLQGNLIGDFIASGDNGLSSPFAILPRATDYIICASSGTNRIIRYDSTGTFVNVIMTSAGTTFPQQLIELENGNFAFAEFSLPGSGIKIITPTGTLVSNYTNVSGLRGIYKLGNGNFLVTNSTGIYEVDGTNGALVRTLLSGAGIVSGQYITKVTLPTGGSTLTSSINLLNGWNLFSVPLVTPDMSVNTLLPNKTSSVYKYDNGYQSIDTAVTGFGYWVKYPSNSQVPVTGTVPTSKTINVKAGWNIIGPYNQNFPVSQISTNPPNNVGSLFYGFNPLTGYFSSDTLKAGNGYFVKFNQNGTITFP